MIDMCSECYSWPCLCIYTNFTAFIVGEESSQFIGIKNIDQNNCFLSTALQALLNTNSFSQVLSAHNSTKDKSIISCLKSIYKTMELCKYNKSSKKIDLYLYRNKLAEICGNEKLGENMQGDAMEIIETILLYMHKASKKSIEATDASSSECTGPCYAHFICNNIIDEIHECSCAKSLIKNNSSVEFIIRLNFASFVSDVPLELIHRFRENFYSELPGMYQKSFMKNKIGTLPTIIAKELVFYI
jgi:Ubiquitin carboxyl-terminal hydrolase